MKIGGITSGILEDSTKAERNDPMKRVLSMLLCVVLLFTCTNAAAFAAETSPLAGNVALDALPSGWVQGDGTITATGGNLYATSAATMTNGQISAEIRLDDSAAVQAGFYFRATSRSPRPIDKGYVVFIHRAGNVNRVEINDGNWGGSLATYDFPFETGTTYTLGVKASGSQLQVLLDGQQILEVESDRYTEGEVGLFRAGGKVTFQSFQLGDVVLSDIFLNGEALAGFSPATHEYVVRLDSSVQTPPTVSAAMNTEGTIECVQAESIPGTAVITATDPEGLTGTYRVEFVRDTTLASLSVNDTPLEGFAPEITQYTCLLPAGQALIPQAQTVATDASAKVEISYPQQLPGNITITVTSEDKTSSSVYQVYCVQAQAPYTAAHVQTIKQTMNFEQVAQAVRDLATRYPDAYDPQYIAGLVDYENRILSLAEEYGQQESLPAGTGSSLAEEYQAWGEAALKANPLLTATKWVVETRKQYAADHHNTHTMFPSAKWEYNDGYFQPGGALKTIDFASGEAQVEVLAETTEGLYCDPDVSYDGTKLLYSYRSDISDSFHLYEMDLTTGQSTQLTNMEFADDLYGLYLPTGEIVFGSNREPKYVMCNTHLQSNLYKMNGDGSNIQQISKNTLFDRPSSIMADGRILYDRWEYTDRDFGDAQGLWAVAPDGTNSVHLYGNYLSSPGGVIDGIEVPGTSQMLAVLCACHDRPWGALALIDTSLGDGEKDSILRTWPANAIDYVIEGEEGMVEQWDYIMQASSTRYEDPYPLDDTYFVVSRTMPSGQMGLVLLDMFGNETILYQESDMGVFSPMPIAAREKPNVIADRRNYDYDFENQVGTGTMFVADVYEGTHMEGVERGTAKTLRIVEAVEKRQYGRNGHWAAKGGQQPAMSWHDLLAKRIWGEVPIEEDGSCYFEVPSDKFLYFQILDEDGKMIQTMRSGTVVQQGETTGCIGCHEDRRMSAPNSDGSDIPLALQKDPVPLNGWSADPEADNSEREIRNFGYMEDVQPVLTKNCLECHDFGGEAADTLVLAPDRNLVFNTSYNEIWRKGYINIAGAGPADHFDAYEKGSHASKLIQVLDSESHADVRAKMTDAEYNALITWIDINGVFYSDYVAPFRENMSGRSPLAARDLLALNQLTGVQMGGGYDQTTNQVYHIYGDSVQWNMKTNQGPLVTFDRPELSPVLSMGNNLNADKNSTAYKQAIAIIERGKQALEERPEVGMEGYQIDGMDAFRQALYNYRTDVNYQMLKAIHDGEKLYDPGLGEDKPSYEEFRFEDWENIIGPVDQLAQRPSGAGDVEGNIPRLGAAPTIPIVDTADPYGGAETQPFAYITEFAEGADVDRHEDYSFMIDGR